MNIDQLKAEIESLGSDEFTELFHWMSEKDWDRWNKKIEIDAQSGRLEFMVRDARERKGKAAPKP